MTKILNPDIYQSVNVPVCLKPYVRVTGYHYFGWIWRGRWQAQVGEETLFDSENDGPFHFSGQVAQREITARLQRDIGQVFLEFAALGHLQILAYQVPEEISAAPRECASKIF